MSTHDSVSAPPALGWLPRPFRRLAAAIERVRRDLRERRELEMLDGNALRDLGLHRSEYGSYLAEASGAANPTRRRIGGHPD